MIHVCTPNTGQPVLGVLLYEIQAQVNVCVEVYRQGQWAETPEGIRAENFHKMICVWFRIEESCGPDALRDKSRGIT